MQKELNPQLFGESSAKSRVVEKTLPPPTLHLEQKLAETKQQVAHLTEALQKVVGQVNEAMKNTHGKMERLSSAIHKLEQNDQALIQEASDKISQLNAKINDRKSMDTKMQELVDRHNNILRTFEVRLNHMQMLLNEKDAQLISSQAALNEAKMEIARLKRM